jgi:hypothetical protein
MVNGVTQSPYEGTSMVYSFDSANAPERHDLQYFEMFGNRGVYFQGWAAITKHRTPWVMGAAKLPAFDDDVWELFDGNSDYSQAHDLSSQHPDKLHELQRLWLIEATKYNVIPLDDRTAERINADIAGRPQLIRGDTQVFYPGMTRLSENSVLNIKNKSFSVTAEVVAPDQPVNGTIIAQGGALGGWSLYTRDGRAKFAYNLLGIQTFTTEATESVPAGSHQVRAEFAYDGGGFAKGGAVSIYYDGQKVGEGRAGATQPSSSRPTRAWTSAARPGPPSPPTTRWAPARSPASSTGSSSRSAKTTIATWSIRRTTSTCSWPANRRPRSPYPRHRR